MNQDEIQLIWQGVLANISTAAALWQLGVILVACVVAWAINGALRAYVMRHAPETWRLGIGGIKRVLFPLSMFVVVIIAKVAFAHWQDTSLLTLASKLLFAMAVIRLSVYAVRYIIEPGGLLKTLENAIAGAIWILLALHLSGLLPDILNTLEDIKFNIGKHPINLLIALHGVVTVLLTIFISLWVRRMIENRIMSAQHININLRVVLTKLLKIFLLFFVVLISLSAVGLDITMLSIFGGALGVGLGFGLQRIASNYLSGFIILLDKSMQIGDVVTINEHYGIVNDLRTRYMLLRKLDGTQVIIPNETLITSPVINHSLTDRKARVQLPIQIGYESPLELAMQIMREIAFRHARVIENPGPVVQLVGFGDSGIDLLLVLWIPDPEEGSATLKTEIYLEIWRAFQQNSISIPFPQREVRILNEK